MARDTWLQEIWYGNRNGDWLRPLEWLFRGGAALRRACYRAGVFSATRLACPVVVVGNLTVGGTGKTPLVIYLVEQLVARGARVAVISRGYGGSAKTVTLATMRADPREVGDEAALIASRTRCHVFVGRDRVAAAQAAAADGADVIVSDDGLQHYALARDVEIVVIDAARGLGNGALLPRGPLREPPDRMRQADLIVTNGALPEALPPGGPRVAVMTLAPSDARLLQGGGPPRALTSFRGEKVHAVAGIGNPTRFFAMLRQHQIDVVPHVFPDHHPFTRADLEFEDGAAVLMTEKDAVKCRAFADSRCWYVPVSAHFSDSERDSVLAPILARLA
jgi:tetraacyldisaccharide 4'-kinase